MDKNIRAEIERQDRRASNPIYQFNRFVALNLRIFKLAKHKH